MTAPEQPPSGKPPESRPQWPPPSGTPEQRWPPPSRAKARPKLTRSPQPWIVATLAILGLSAAVALIGVLIGFLLGRIEVELITGSSKRQSAFIVPAILLALILILLGIWAVVRAWPRPRLGLSGWGLRRWLVGLAVISAGIVLVPAVLEHRSCGWRIKIDDRADVSGCDFSGDDLSEVDSPGADLSAANLTGATLSGAKLESADLSNAELSEADLSGQADLSEATLSRASLTEANLRGADLTAAQLQGATLSGADLGSANLTDAQLQVANLSGQTGLRQANLSGADLTEANLSGADLTAAQLQGANLSRADLAGANMSEVQLQGADLSSVDLGNTTLDGANLSDASWGGANLERASLLKATGLSDTDLESALGVPRKRLARALVDRRIALESRSSVLGAFGKVCRGGRVPKATGYPKGGYHPTVVLKANGKPGAPTRAVPKRWVPAAVRFGQLVACVGSTQRQSIEVCGPYTKIGGAPSSQRYFINRYRIIRKAKLIAARTGKVVARRSFSGSEPRACKQTESLGLSEISGSFVRFGGVREWVRRFVD